MFLYVLRNAKNQESIGYQEKSMLNKNGPKNWFANGVMKNFLFITLDKKRIENIVIVIAIWQRNVMKQIVKFNLNCKRRFVFLAENLLSHLNGHQNAIFIVQKHVLGVKCGINMVLLKNEKITFIESVGMLSRNFLGLAKFVEVKLARKFTIWMETERIIFLAILQYFAEVAILLFTELQLLKYQENGK